MRHSAIPFVFLASFLSTFISVQAWALNPNDRVDNFELLDHTGKAHELYYLSDAKAVVLMSFNNNCPALDSSLKQFQKVRKAYSDKGVEFLLVNSDLTNSRQAIVVEAERLGIESPILMKRIFELKSNTGSSAQLISVTSPHCRFRNATPN